MGKTLRDAYGDALLRYACENEDVVVLDADVSGSTKSCTFGNACCERFFNVGIAESNMTGMAAGLAAVGKIPFINTFAAFLSTFGLISAKAFASYANMNMKFVGGYGGLSDSFDGPSHQSVEDIAIFRSLPNFKVFVASDEVQTGWLVKHAIDFYGPMYIRLSRERTSELYGEHAEFEEGKGVLLREGGDATVLACGVMSGIAVRAAEILSRSGIEVSVIDMFTIKPIDRELILESARKTGAFVTAEEHSVIGGLGSAVAEVLATENVSVPCRFVGMADCHAECGPYGDLLSKYGLDDLSIVVAVQEVVRMKKRPRL